jgi:hypothetical protein
VALPAVLYGLWYVDYGRQASNTDLQLWTGIPGYVLRSLSSTISGVTGLSQLHSPASSRLDPYYGWPLAIALLVVLAVVLWRGWRPPHIVWGVAATLLVLWISSCLNNLYAERPADVARYLPVNAAFLLIAVCASVPRPRLGRAGGAAACAVLAVVCATNAAQYSAARGADASSSVSSRALLGGLLLTRGVVSPAFIPGWDPPAYLAYVQAGPYFSAVDSFGTDADSAAALQREPEAIRGFADGLIARAERVEGLPPPLRTARGATPPAVLSGSAQPRRGCLVLGANRVTLAVPAGGVRLDAPPRTGVTVSLARFASAFTVGLGQLAPGGSGVVRLPADRAPQVPWRVELSGAGTRVCALGPTTGRAFVTSVSLIDRGSGIPPNGKVVTTFSEATDHASTTRAFSLARASDGKPVVGSVTFLGDHVPIFVPNSPLAPATRYTATISQAAMDQAGNHPAPTTWSFTTSR